eukprot:3595367-Rhodomonas_salina.1
MKSVTVRSSETTTCEFLSLALSPSSLSLSLSIPFAARSSITLYAHACPQRVTLESCRLLDKMSYIMTHPQLLDEKYMGPPVT